MHRVFSAFVSAALFAFGFLNSALGAPTVTLTAPPNNALYHAPANITVNATASAPAPATIARVEFYANGTLIGTDTTASYSIAWSGVAAGTYTLIARAVDNGGVSTDSAPFTVTISATNTAPTITLSAPPNNAKYLAPATITVSATATAPEVNGSVSKVDFYANGNLIGTDTTSPFSISWAGAPAGSYTLTAIAADQLGASTTSAARTVVIVDSDAPPSVSLSAPASGSVYVDPASITVSATAASQESNVTITKVDFYANGNLIGSDTTSPYSIAWASPAAGGYSLTAVVTDSVGTQATSAARSVTVNAANTPPMVTMMAPAANAKYALPATVTLSATATAPEANDTIAKVEFFANGILVGTVTTSPYNFSWVNPPAGTYSLTATATDALGGTTTTAARSITVVGTGAPPTVALSAPANAAIYVNPASLTVTATATSAETNVTIAKVEFYANGTLIGTDTASPYTIAWTSPPAGTYILTAKATDSLGIEATSAARTVTINATNTPPTVTLSAPPANAHYVLPVTVALSAAASAVEVNDSITKVDFLANGAVVGTVTTSPYNFSWVNPAAGTYSLTAVATDAQGGTTTSAARSITVASTHTPPTVTLSAPANAAVYVNPVSIMVSAAAVSGDTNVTLTKVDFYANGNLIGTDTTSPYSIAWASPAPGTYSITAVVTDSLNTTTTSAARTITVNGTNTPPAVTMTAPAANAKYALPATIPLSATATSPEANDTIAKVRFFANSTLVGTVTTSPYNFSWVNPPAGTYALTATATDALGGTTTTPARSITVVGTGAPPTVALSAPANAAVYVNPASITVTAAATSAETNVTIAKVEFYANGALIGTDTASPYSIAWPSPAAGTYTLTAKATDSLGIEATSAARTVTINATNTPPTVTMTAPAANSRYLLPANVTLSATATAPETNDTVAKVEFFANGSLVGTVTTSPYNFTWINPPAGTYSLTAIATDALGGSTTTSARSITVTSTHTAPTVSLSAPANAAIYVNPTSITVSATAAIVDTNVPIMKVDFYANGALIGTDTASPYSIAWASPAPGTYSLTAVVTDAQNTTTTSAARTITVNATNTPPTVSLTAPANGAKYVTPVNITLSATASAVEANDSIANVEFRANGNLVGTVVTSPYNFTWTNVPGGTYTLTAIATDGQGGVTTSASRSITVTSTNVPPTVSITAPANNASYVAPATINITTNPNDSDGTIAKVELYSNATLIATLTSSPFTYSYTNVAPGTYALTAIATDNQGATAASSAVNVTVNANQSPTVNLTSPANNAVFTAPASITLTANPNDSDGTIAKVEFLNGSNVIATLTSTPWTFDWTNVGAGAYTLAVRATDDKGAQTTSAPVNVTVNAASATIYYVYLDQINTPRAITNEAATPVWKWDNVDPFGANAPNEDPDGDSNKFTFNLRFPGQYFDKEMGMHYNYFRDYDPAQGRYIESDPLGQITGINTFTYTSGNPLAASDFFGLWSREAHSYFIDNAFPWLSNSDRANIKFGSEVADNGYYQSADFAYMHAMSSASLSKASALEKYCDFISKKLAEYRRNIGDSRSREHAYRNLGMALHAVMDSTSPSHSGFQKWSFSERHRHGDFSKSEETIDAAPKYLEETVEKMRKLFLNGELPAECRCR